ncbi:MAG: hypothetical protein IKE62_00815 [Oscillospiraceae bacterium]|nr:hypothetical protein [Oscillospiraceae bacterium]
MSDVSDERSVRELLLRSRTESRRQIESVFAAQPLRFKTLCSCIRNYILARFLLTQEECEGVDFQRLADLSLSKTMKISPEQVREFDTARSCAGATSAMVKKTLLYMSLQKELNIELDAPKTPKVHSFEEFAQLVWDAMLKTEFWPTRMDCKEAHSL